MKTFRKFQTGNTLALKALSRSVKVHNTAISVITPKLVPNIS